MTSNDIHEEYEWVLVDEEPQPGERVKPCASLLDIALGELALREARPKSAAHRMSSSSSSSSSTVKPKKPLILKKPIPLKPKPVPVKRKPVPVSPCISIAKPSRSRKLKPKPKPVNQCIAKPSRSVKHATSKPCVAKPSSSVKHDSFAT